MMSLTIPLEEAAEVLDCTPQILYEAIDRDEVPYLRIGQRIHISRGWVNTQLKKLEENDYA